MWIVDHVAPVRVRGPRTRGARANEPNLNCLCYTASNRGPRLEYSGSADGASATSPVLTAWLVAEAAEATPARLPHGVARLPHGVARLPHGVVRLPHGVARLPHGVVQA